MGLRFRKRIKIAKGVYINVNKNSVGISAGVKGARVSINSKGNQTTSIGIPGTGISYVTTENLAPKKSKSKKSTSKKATSRNSVVPKKKDPLPLKLRLIKLTIGLSIFSFFLYSVNAFLDESFFKGYAWIFVMALAFFVYAKFDDHIMKTKTSPHKTKEIIPDSEPLSNEFEEGLKVDNQFVYVEPDEEPSVEIIEPTNQKQPRTFDSKAITSFSFALPIKDIQVQESLDLLHTTINPMTYFSRLDYIELKLNQLGETASLERFLVASDDLTSMFFYRYYLKLLNEHKRLKLESAKLKRVNSFESTINMFKNQLSQNNLDYAEDCLKEFKGYHELSLVQDSNDLSANISKSRPRPISKENHLPSTYVSIDLETTGFSHHNDSIIEIAGVKVVDNKVVDIFCELIDPGIAIPSRVTRITGITNDDVDGKPSIDEILPKFTEFVGDSLLVGHNIKSFDCKFLDSAKIKITGSGFDNKILDTLYLSRKLIPDSQNHKLATLVDYFEIKVDRQHRATDDALAVVGLMEELAKY